VSQAVTDRVPFYLYLSHYAIHAPWEKDTRFLQRYIDGGLTPFEATYASMVEGMDKSLGDILDHLEGLGVADNTVVVFMSDNGSPSQAPRNLPLRGHKLTPYEGGIRVPMLARWPGVTPQGLTSETPVIIEDLFPTFLELAGVRSTSPPAGTIDGVSLVPWLKGATQQGTDRSLFWHYPNTYNQPPYSAVRTGDWKLIYHHATRRLELFNLRFDIGETQDRSQIDPVRLEELAGILTEFLRSSGAQMPVDRESGVTVEYPIDAWRRQQTPGRTRSKANVPFSAIAENLEWVGVAIQEPDYTIWGASPIIAKDGKVHLFAARWPELNVDPAWRKSSEIAHYVADRPEGPFAFRSVVLRGSGRTGEWDAFAPHNPEIARFGDTYVLLYIGNSDYHQPPHPLNQQIGMAVAPSVHGPWKKVGTDGLILGPSPDPTHWTHGHQVVNPAILKVGTRYHLYFKSRYQDGTGYGVAIADQLEGPYVMEPEPLSSEGVVIEDGTVFMWGGKVCLITTDNHGRVTGIRGGGALWVSDDGKQFDPQQIQVAYDRIPQYVPSIDLDNIRKVYGPDPKIERPKILTLDEEPRYLYGPSGWVVHGGSRTANYVLRIQLPEDAGPLSAESSPVRP
jgi:hypothetical protein